MTARPQYQTAHWRVHLRKQAYELAGYRCRACGALGKERGGSATLTLDHVVPVRFWPAGKKERVQDVVVLCKPCHMKKDRKKRGTYR